MEKHMQSTNECLQAAMFIAAESYSGSTYETILFGSKDNICDDPPVITDENVVPTMAA
jgi:hypothetical protein